MESILDWDEKLNELRKNKPEVYTILNKIYHHYSDYGSMIIPPTFKERAIKYMGHESLSTRENLERIEKQKIIKFNNKWTGEGAVFNSLRAQRPGIRIHQSSDELRQLIEDSKKNCDFCNPEKYTPEDLFGRVKGKYCITASNLAKYDAWSSLLIFNKHNPLDFSQDELSDYLKTAFNWFKKVYEYDEDYQYPFLIWNCLYKAGASQVHGHAQILMTKEFPYAKIENLQKTIRNYKKIEGKDYFSDLFSLHQSLGLAINQGDVKIILSLTPIKEKEILIISRKSPIESIEFNKSIYKVLRCYIDFLGVDNFNLAIYSPEITGGEFSLIKDFPYLVKIVDRGPFISKTTDIGGMELYGGSVASDDPYKIMGNLRECWEKF